MKKLIGPFMFAMVLGVGMASLSFAAGDMAAPSTQTVNGDLLKIDAGVDWQGGISDSARF